MDQALKARLIGAGILVVLAVLLLPELLSGPQGSTGAAVSVGGKGTRTVVIDLGGAVSAGAQLESRAEPVPAPAPSLPAVATGQPEATVTDVPEVPVDEPSSTSVAAASSAPAPASLPVEAKPTVTASQPPNAAPVKGGFSVQVGAFGSAAGARKLVDDLQGDGLPAYLLMPAPGKKLHRVRVGPVPDRAAADRLATRLKARGLPVAVVADG